MKVATILFTYNRPWHTQQVLDGLSRNSILPEKLFIFQDGLNPSHDEKSWREVGEIIHSVQYCPVEIIKSEENKGLARSIVDGINYVLENNDAVIVLEDDCVPAPDFMKFMYQAFSKYREEQRVYCVSGYAWQINVEHDQYDAYFNGRACSWGWGTWKDRWLQYNQDNRLLERIMSDRGQSIELAAWGRDLPRTFFDRMKGRNNSWAVYFALKVIEKKGLCICPYETLINNIGCDGSGVHCGISKEYEGKLDVTVREAFSLPDEIVILDWVYKSFKDFLGSCLVKTVQENHEENVIIYGMGDFFAEYENDIASKYPVVALCDRERKGFYAGIEIINISRIADYVGSKVIIMIRDMQLALEVSNELQKEYGIDSAQIVFGTELFE